MSLLALVGRGRVGAEPDPPPAGDWDLAANRPSGEWTLASDVNWGQGELRTPTSGDWAFFTDPVTSLNWFSPFGGSTDYPSLVEDVTAPSGNGQALRLTFNGVADGGSARYAGLSFSASNEVFFACIQKFDAAWTQPNGIKFHYWNSASGPDVGWIDLKQGTPSTTPNVRWGFQTGVCTSGNCGTGGQVTADPTTLLDITPGAWVKLQYRLRRDPGLIQLWVNDVLLIDNSGFTWSSTSGFTEVNVVDVWGGGNAGPGASNHNVFMDATALWRRN